MKRADLLPLAGVIACMFSSLSFANPIPSNAISEIQVTDSLHWAVEVDCDKLYISPKLPAPGSTDTVTLYCSQATTFPPQDSMRICVKPEQIDSGRIILLTPQHFPGLKIKKGWTVFLGIKAQSENMGQLQIPLSLTPQQSLVSGNVKTCCDYLGGRCLDSCSESAFLVSSCPSIGVRNSFALGSITGTVMGNDCPKPPKIRVFWKSNTDQSETYVTALIGSSFSIGALDSCHTYTLRFADSTGASISDTIIGPLKIKRGGAIAVNVRLDYPPVDAALPHGTRSGDAGAAVRILPSAIGNRIVLTVSGYIAARQGTIDIFSTNGSVLRSISFDFSGPGTYTVQWDGRSGQNQPVPAGTYICRARIGKDVSCKGFVTR